MNPNAKFSLLKTTIGSPPSESSTPSPCSRLSSSKIRKSVWEIRPLPDRIELGAKGILDFHFEELNELESDNPCLVVEPITMFLCNADCSIAELLRTLGAPVINYSRVTEIAFQPKGSSSRFSQLLFLCLTLIWISVASFLSTSLWQVLKSWKRRKMK